MEVYVAYCHDRHTDPVVRVFSGQRQACDFVRLFMHENIAHRHGIREATAPGYVLYLSYDYETDHAFVVQRRIDEE